MRARTALAVAGLLAGLTGCADTVVGSGSPRDGGAAGPTSSPSDSPTTPTEAPAEGVACEWTPVGGRGSSVVDADPPPDVVPDSGHAELVMSTNLGDLTVVVDQEDAPCAAAALVALAEQGFFDGSPCHRQTDTPGLQVLQCGDPTGTGTGGPPWQYPTDVDGSEVYSRGTVSMANAGRGFDGSQFFLVWGQAELPPSYTQVGTVDVGGLAVLDAVGAAGNDGANGPGDGAPNEPVTIESMTVA
ncbi:peptidylprolyl isomerase [Geodermatophilus sp. SYSU D00815]